LNFIYIVYVGCAMIYTLREKINAVPGVFQLAMCHSTTRTCWLMVMRLIARLRVEYVVEHSSLSSKASRFVSGRVNSVCFRAVGWRVQVAPPCRQDKSYVLRGADVRPQ